MALVSIKDYEGSLIGNSLLDILTMLEVTNLLGKRGYAISVMGINKSTPKGFIDDTPDEHEIELTKNFYIGKDTEFDYVVNGKIDENNIKYKKDLDSLKIGCLRFKGLLGINTKDEKYISVDDKGYCWYNHSFKFRIKQGNRDEESYIKYMLDVVMDIISNSK